MNKLLVCIFLLIISGSCQLKEEKTDRTKDLYKDELFGNVKKVKQIAYVGKDKFGEIVKKEDYALSLNHKTSAFHPDGSLQYVCYKNIHNDVFHGFTFYKYDDETGKITEKIHSDHEGNLTNKNIFKYSDSLSEEKKYNKEGELIGVTETIILDSSTTILNKSESNYLMEKIIILREKEKTLTFKINPKTIFSEVDTTFKSVKYFVNDVLDKEIIITSPSFGFLINTPGENKKMNIKKTEVKYNDKELRESEVIYYYSDKYNINDTLKETVNYTYSYDGKGNWIKKIKETSKISSNNLIDVFEREIEYYVN